MSATSSFPEFERVAAIPEAEINLAEAALVLASHEYPGLDIGAQLDVLDQFADEIRATLPVAAGPAAVLEHARQYLFDVHGFVGNERNFYDPRNSFLNEVLQRKLGIPITLSVLYLEVAWRLGVALQGVSLPGRFMVGLFNADETIIIDPFGGGVRLSAEELESNLEQMFGPLRDVEIKLQDLLVPTTKRELLTRMLRNLKSIYLATRDFERALAAVERMLLLEPTNAAEVRDRGFVLYHLDCIDAARADLHEYLMLAPDAPDVTEVSSWLEKMAPTGTRLN